MAIITNYATLIAALRDWLARDDLVGDEINFLQNAEFKLYRGPIIRTRHFETALSVTTSSGVAALPTRYVALRHAYVDQSPTRMLEHVPAEIIYERFPQRTGDGVPEYIAREGSNFIFGPYPSGSYDIKGIYYQRPEFLHTTAVTTNWFTDNAPELLLYATLLEAAPFLRDNEWVQYWQQKYDEIERDVIRDSQDEFAGAALRQQAV